MSTIILNVHNNPVNFAFLYLTKTAKTLLFSNFFYVCYIHSKTRSLLHAEIILADFCVKLKYVLFVPRTLRTVGKHGVQLLRALTLGPRCTEGSPQLKFQLT